MAQMVGRNRRSIRLRRYDYSSAGAYFVTICTKDRECLFGKVVEGEMRMNTWGDIVRACWDNLSRHYGRVVTDAFVVMPNHVHGIIMITDDRNDNVGTGLKPAPTSNHTKRHGLSEIVRAFKTFSARRINESRGIRAVPVWQRNYYERVVRNADEMNRIRQYVAANPAHWTDDENNPMNHVGAGLKPAHKSNGRTPEIERYGADREEAG
jgi:putative transposase